MEPIRNLFAALFLASIGMLIHVQFLWTHVDILLASVILVIVFKTIVATMITKVFGYNIRTSVIVSHPSKHLLDKNYIALSFMSLNNFTGWAFACTNWRICICALESCLKPAYCSGDLILPIYFSPVMFLIVLDLPLHNTF